MKHKKGNSVNSFHRTIKAMRKVGKVKIKTHASGNTHEVYAEPNSFLGVEDWRTIIAGGICMCFGEFTSYDTRTDLNR